MPLPPPCRLPAARSGSPATHTLSRLVREFLSRLARESGEHRCGEGNATAGSGTVEAGNLLEKLSGTFPSSASRPFFFSQPPGTLQNVQVLTHAVNQDMDMYLPTTMSARGRRPG